MTDEAGAPLYERVYLVAYDPQQARLYSRARTAFLVRAGVLVDLAYRGAAHEAGGRVHVDHVGDLGDPVLAAVVSEIATTSRSWRAWMRRGYKQTLALTEDHLSDKGVLVRPAPGFGAGRSVPVRDPAAIAALHAHVRSVLVGQEPGQGTDRDDAALGVLAAVGGVPFVPRAFRTRYRTRFNVLAGRAGEGFPGIEPALRKLKRTMIAARGGMG